MFDSIVARDTISAQYLNIAGLALVLYDHALTLPVEVELVWPAQRSATKLAFLINRYFSPLLLAFACTINSQSLGILDELL
ncbi:hypothetical protein RhiJN_11556 [Ceratobasidium sp. AG-Ba]|nr:hypothetical protein RhiJN_11556 [Ceratobasidium sp. AG-Ba]QRW12251.1 hypothetical protein RhiLY_11250 [Ceratobasidium sp. AG-Ba]